MKSLHRPRPQRLAIALVTLLAALVSVVWSQAPSSADTLFPPATGAFTASIETGGSTYDYAPIGSPPTSHGPTISGVSDGQSMTVSIDGNSPPNATESAFSNLRVRQCKGGTTVNNIVDFDPFTTNKCTSVGLGAGDDIVDTGPLVPGTTTASVVFKAGIGTAPDTISGFDGSTLPGFTCDAANPCQIVMNVQVTSGVGANVFLSYPIEFSGVADVPGTPEAPTATAGDGQASVSWTAPGSDGGSAITDYTVTSSPGGFMCTKAAPPLTCDVAGLTNGTPYTFTVVATNAIGDSDPSDPSNEVTPRMAVGDLFTGITPTRILDSRPAFQVGPYSTPWAAAETREVTVADGTTVPADADAVTLNVTATQTNAVSYLSIWPKGESQPVVSSLNWDAGWTVPNSVTVKVGDGGMVDIYNNLGTVNVIVDVVGYYKDGVGAGFTSVTPERILDSRPAFQVGPYSTPWAAAETREVMVADGTTVPTEADSVVLNVTATQTNAVSYLSIWPNGEAKPVVSSLNWASGWTIPNAVTVKVGDAGKVKIYNDAGTTNVIVDVVGYFKAGVGVPYHPLSPERILDSRPAFQVGPFNTPWAGATTCDLTVTGVGGVPATGVDAVLTNFTVTQTTAVGYLTVWPKGETQPLVSSLNWDPGWTISNAVTAKVGTGGQIQIYNNLGSTNVLADVAGWYG